MDFFVGDVKLGVGLNIFGRNHQALAPTQRANILAQVFFENYETYFFLFYSIEFQILNIIVLVVCTKFSLIGIPSILCCGKSKHIRRSLRTTHKERYFVFLRYCSTVTNSFQLLSTSTLSLNI